MRTEHDLTARAAYIYLIEGHVARVARTVRATPDINMDFDQDGHLIGIELLRLGLLHPRIASEECRGDPR